MSTNSDVVNSARKFASSTKDEALSIIIDGLCSIIDRLEEQLLKSESQNYCMICGNTLDGYVPPEYAPSEKEILKELLRYAYNLPMNEAGDYDENVEWCTKVKQILEGK